MEQRRHAASKKHLSFVTGVRAKPAPGCHTQSQATFFDHHSITNLLNKSETVKQTT